MPKIVEIKRIDGDIWVKIDPLILNTEVGSISLYTPEEIEHIKRCSVEDVLEAAAQYVEKVGSYGWETTSENIRQLKEY